MLCCLVTHGLCKTFSIMYDHTTVNPRFKPWGLFNFMVHNHPGFKSREGWNGDYQSIEFTKLDGLYSTKYSIFYVCKQLNQASDCKKTGQSAWWWQMATFNLPQFVRVCMRQRPHFITLEGWIFEEQQSICYFCDKHYIFLIVLGSSEKHYIPFSLRNRCMNFFGAMVPTFFFCVAMLWNRSPRHVSNVSFFTFFCCCLYCKTFSRNGLQKYNACSTELQ